MRFFSHTSHLLYSTIALGLIAGASFFWWSSGERSANTLTVHPAEFLQQISVSGKIVPVQSVDLAFSAGGRISVVRVTVGDRVARGMVLASVDNADLAAEVEQKRAALSAARARYESLLHGTRLEQIAVTRSIMASAETALDAAYRALTDAGRTAYTQSDDAVRHRVDQFMSNSRTASPHLNLSTYGSRLKGDIEMSRVVIERLLQIWQADVGALSPQGEGVIVASAETAAKNLATVAGFLDNVALVVNILTPTASFSQTVIDGYRTDIITGRANVNTAAAGLTSARTIYTNAVASLTTAKKNLELEEAGATADDIAARASDMAVVEADLQRVQAQYQKKTR